MARAVSIALTRSSQSSAALICPSEIPDRGTRTRMQVSQFCDLAKAFAGAMAG